MHCMTEEIQKGKIKNKSLQKAINVLNCFIEKQPLGVTEISEMLDLYKSNVFDILSTLAAMGYVEKNEESGKYYLGIGAVKLGRAAKEANGFQRIAGIHIRQLAKETGETCYLTVPQGYTVFYLDAVAPFENHPFMTASMHNFTDTMNSTSSGKCMLAYMSEAFIEDYLSAPLPRFTEYTITDPELMRKELSEIRQRGYAVDNMENSIGIKCVAMPILNGDGAVVGAVSVSGPSPRFTEEKIEQFAKLLSKHIKEICSAL